MTSSDNDQAALTKTACNKKTMREIYHNTPHGKRLIAKNQNSFLRRLDDKVFLQLSQHPHGRPSPEYAVHLAQRDGRGDR